MNPASPKLFHPKLFTTLRDYSLRLFVHDLTSGVLVGIVALPLAIAFAIASGVTPERGLITAVVAGFLISALGGSRVQVGGPTGAYVVIVYDIVEKHGVSGLLLCTLMAGLFLIAMGLLRLGAVLKFLPYPLTVGFTAGIAVVIFSSQIKDFLGLRTGPLPGDFIPKWQALLKALPTADPTTVAVSLGALAVLILWPRLRLKIPGSVVALGVLTTVVHVFRLPVETIGSRFGDLPRGLPAPALPHFSFEEVRNLIGPALTVAILGGIESLLSATVADGMIEGRHRPNTELIAQGIANVAAPLFGGIPATGAIARTATNVRNGGRTPVAGIVHSLTLLLILLALGPLARMIPLCVLAVILMLVAYHMGEWHAFRALLKAPRMDVAVLVTTFLLTVFTDLTVAVEVGVVLSAFLFMKRMTDVTTVRQVEWEVRHPEDEASLRADPDATTRRSIPEGVEVYEAEGAFFFGVTELVRDLLDLSRRPPKALILRMRHVLALDASGLRALSDLKRQCEKKKIELVLSGVHSQPLVALEQSGLLKDFGENVVGAFEEALTRVGKILNATKP